MLKTIARFYGSGQPQKKASRNRVRLSVESLESRDVPTTFTVSDPRDLALAQIPVISNPGQPPQPAFLTLRAAVQLSEQTPGADTIQFLLPQPPAGTSDGEEGGGGGAPAMTWLHLDTAITKANRAEALTILGPGPTTLGIQANATANNKFRIFNLNGGDVSISGLAFQGGWSSGDGGAINVIADNFTLQNCQFYNNKADGNGGAIAHGPIPAGPAADVGNLTISICLFANSSAIGFGSNGGDIHSAAVSSTVSVKSTTLRNSTATKYGGAISISSNGTAKDVLIGDANTGLTLFLQNTAQKGGAFSVIGNAVDVQMTNTAFLENTGHDAGGGIYASGGSTSFLSFLNTTFTGNFVVTTGSGGERTGGAVQLDSQSAIFTDCSFTNNSAKYGGAIFVNLASVTLVNSIFQNNSASILGPTICYAGVLNQNTWVYNIGSNIGANDIVLYVPQP